LLGATLVFAGFLVRGADAQLSKPAPPDAEYRRLLLGTWEDHYQGHRIMTVHEDGTATMLVELSGWKAALYAARLRFDMTWSVEDGTMKKRTVGGEPSGRVRAILKMMGDHVVERILELTENRLVLQDQEGKHQYQWTRVKTVKPE
jgi:hypothetical protein